MIEKIVEKLRYRTKSGTLEWRKAGIEGQYFQVTIGTFRIKIDKSILTIFDEDGTCLGLCHDDKVLGDLYKLAHKSSGVDEALDDLLLLLTKEEISVNKPEEKK